jgi:hypothetical protein
LDTNAHDINSLNQAYAEKYGESARLKAGKVGMMVSKTSKRHMSTTEAGLTDVYECEKRCGFRGSYAVVAQHELQCNGAPAARVTKPHKKRAPAKPPTVVSSTEFQVVAKPMSVKGWEAHLEGAQDLEHVYRPHGMHLHALQHSDSIEEASLEWTPPSAKAAQDFVGQNHPHNTKLGKLSVRHDSLGRHCFEHCCICDPLCEGANSSVLVFGVGISNYFKFIKWSGWMCFVLFLISLPKIIISTWGDGDGTTSDATWRSFFAATTMGNLGDSYNTTNVRVPKWVPGCELGATGGATNSSIARSEATDGDLECTLDKLTLGTCFALLDCVGVVVFLAGYYWLKHFAMLEEHKVHSYLSTASDFTVLVTNIPHNTTADDLRRHFTDLVQRKRFGGSIRKKFLSKLGFIAALTKRARDCKTREMLLGQGDSVHWFEDYRLLAPYFECFADLPEKVQQYVRDKHNGTELEHKPAIDLVIGGICGAGCGEQGVGGYDEALLPMLGITDRGHAELLVKLRDTCMDHRMVRVRGDTDAEDEEKGKGSPPAHNSPKHVHSIVIAEDSGELIRLYQARGVAVKNRNYTSAKVLRAEHLKLEQQRHEFDKARVHIHGHRNHQQRMNLKHVMKECVKEKLTQDHVGRLVGVHLKSAEEVKAAVSQVGGVYEEWMVTMAGRFARVAAVDFQVAGKVVVTLKLPPGLLSSSDINHHGEHARELHSLDFANSSSEQTHNPMHGHRGKAGKHGHKGKGNGKVKGSGHASKQTVHLNFGSGGGGSGGEGEVPTTIQLPVDVLCWPCDSAVAHLSELVKRKAHLNRQIAEVNKKRLSLPRHEDAICAFVTFNEEKVVSEVLRYYHSSTTALGFLFQPREMRLSLKNDDHRHVKDGHCVEVRPAPAPDTIVWENLEYDGELRMRGKKWRVITRNVLLTSMLIFASLIVSFLAKFIQQQDEEDTDSAVTSSSSYSKTVNALYASSSALAAFVNAVVAIILRRLSRSEIHSNISAREISLFRRMALLSFLNTGVVIMISNSSWFLSIFDGKERTTKDFDTEWYQTVGSSVILICVLSIATPHIDPMIKWARHGRKKRLYAATQITQAKLNQLYLGKEFYLSDRYAYSVSMMAVTLMYGSGMPILYLISAVHMLVAFWVNKYLFIHFYRTPPHYDASLGKVAVSRLPYALLLHMGIAIWMYSNKAIFLSKTTTALQSGQDALANYDSLNVGDKLLQQHVLPLVLLFIFYALYLFGLHLRASLRVIADILRAAVHGLAVCVNFVMCVHDVVADDSHHEERVAKHKKHAFEYGDMLECDRIHSYSDRDRLRSFSSNSGRTSPSSRSGVGAEIKGIPTYNILQNPRYAEPFAIDTSDERVAELAWKNDLTVGDIAEYDSKLLNERHNCV